MTGRRLLRGAVALAGAVTLASIARADAPSDQYDLFDMNDVTIADAYTKLTWQRYPTTPLTFDGAAAYCQGLSLGAFTGGWRVPSYKELLTLVDESPHVEYESGQPVFKAIDRHAFGATPAGIATPTTPDPDYWTSSVPGWNASSAYSVSFSDGTASLTSKTATSYVRCVHDP